MKNEAKDVRRVGVKRTLLGLRLAKSIATAPPMDWPYRILKVEKE